MNLKMPDRQPSDGGVSVERRRLGEPVVISVTTGGQEQTIICSEYNAWRVVGLLSVMLGLPLSAAAGKAIKL